MEVQDLFKETIAEFTENGLDAELDDELGYSTPTRTRIQMTAGMAKATKPCARDSEKARSLYPRSKRRI